MPSSINIQAVEDPARWLLDLLILIVLASAAVVTARAYADQHRFDAVVDATLRVHVISQDSQQAVSANIDLP